jgi:hypothetical protein
MLLEPVPVLHLVQDEGISGAPVRALNTNPVITLRPDPENGIAASGLDKKTVMFRSVIVSPFGNVRCRQFPHQKVSAVPPSGAS